MEAIDRILSSSVRAQARSVDSVFKNLVEEVGELSRALNRPWRCDEPAIGEIADVMNCVVDLAYLLKMEELTRGIRAAGENIPSELFSDAVVFTKDQINGWVDKKCSKWDGLVEVKREALD